MFYVRFWGVRGSIPCPGTDTIKYGGNTSCIEIRAGKKLIIIDFGSGIKDLSTYLLKNECPDGNLDADIFVTHTHMDHIIGFPMFAPLFMPKARLRIYGPILPGEVTLHSVFSNEIAYEYWPIKLTELDADIIFEQIRETKMELEGGVTVRSKFLNHTLVTLSFRFEYKGKSIVTLFDCESFRNVFTKEKDIDFYGKDAYLAGCRAVEDERKKLEDFCLNADILIHDSQYENTEYMKNRENWGHSTFSDAIELANRTNTKKLVFFHHDPIRTDKQLDAIAGKLPNENTIRDGLEIFIAQEGLVLEA